MGEAEGHDDEAAALRAEVADIFEGSDTAAQLVDEQGHLVWTSSQMLAITGLSVPDGHDAEHRVGAAAIETSGWSGVVRGADADAIAARLATDSRGPVWQHTMPVRIDGHDQALGVLGIRLHAADGRPVGTALVYSPQLPAQVVAMLARGDASMFARMAALTEPAPHAAAVVFADLEASSRLARRLSTHHYFAVIRAVTTAVDTLITDRSGIVGKHAGDGTSAYFLAEHCGGESGAARAGLSLALELPRAVHAAVAGLVADDVAVDPDDCPINVGAHWSADLYMGQVVTGGRLEISALGDAVNETARIEQAARRGDVLASKALLERLLPHDAEALGLDPRTCTYEVLGDRSDGDKVQRDAGSLSVTCLALGHDAGGSGGLAGSR